MIIEEQWCKGLHPAKVTARSLRERLRKRKIHPQVLSLTVLLSYALTVLRSYCLTVFKINH
jgi:hypothetical protein